MGDFRITYGSAIGKQNNFFAKTDGLIAEGDTTPDVTNGTLFYTNNTTTTVITYFDLTSVQGANTQPGLFEGKEIKVLFLDDSTSLSRTNQLIISGTDGLIGRNGIAEFIYHNSAWYETNRSVNGSGFVTVESKNLYTVSAGTGGVDVRGGVSVVRIIAGASSSATIRALVNGVQGQVVTLIASGASDATVIVNSASNIDGTFVSTTSATPTQFRLMSSGAISFIKQGNQWLELRPVSGNSSGQLQ